MPATGRHIPQRTCLACRQVKDKHELVRLVRNESGRVEIDVSSKKPGRGVYLCRDLSCWEAGLRQNRLEHGLKSSVTLDNREELLERARELLRGAICGKG